MTQHAGKTLTAQLTQTGVDGGAALIGVLYDRSIDSAITFTVIVQAAALIAFVPLLSYRPTTRAP